MSNEIHNPSRRDFLKGVTIGAGGYAFGSMLIHPKEAEAQSRPSGKMELCMHQNTSRGAGYRKSLEGWAKDGPLWLYRRKRKCHPCLQYISTSKFRLTDKSNCWILGFVEAVRRH